jgi:leucyl-tRNA---protein transferase
MVPPDQSVGGMSGRRLLVDRAPGTLDHVQWNVPMNLKAQRRPQFFYTTAPLPCPYVAGRTERKVVTEITGPSTEAMHDRLSRAGFRRSHNIAYAPVCPACQSCIPIRIPVANFQPDAALRRIARKNAQVEGFVVAPRATAEQFQLFQRYQQARHGDGDMATMSFYDYRAMVEDTPVETFLTEFRDPDTRLISACLTDRLGDGLSAVYSFYAPTLEKRSLGTHAILWLIERARQLDLPYVYLGYWVPESRKMAYKSRFRPSEVLMSGTWRMLTDADTHSPGATLAESTLVTEPTV